ncbi:hypothetical protein PQ469_03280 [Mucilaginibacter sp. KACC 22773]|uniref:hypothetical protein n=1 Tax=Mucilaginibacter sp. KACC 22773 TaxID=3025671 RepID=UPI00236680BB|nr:hypothetical protein [Mucilaginibacter sp. KACC 22773]WDF79028.1 hypothetical protein PQ469_03280 [Mucilaginibacter sp. KACC 22773]
MKDIRSFGSKDTFLVCKQNDQPPRPWINGIHLPFAVRKEDCKNFQASGKQFFVQLWKRGFTIYLMVQDVFLLIYK